MKFSTAVSFAFVILPALKLVSGHSVRHLNQRANGNNGSVAATASDDPQSSQTLDPRVLASGFEQNGQEVPTAGQVASLTSSNNFINFCLTVPNQQITNGKQIAAGSCNPAPMGSIPSTANMPSAKFTFPKNGGIIAANTQFTVSMAISKLNAGNFVNADTNYFSAPQQLSAQGTITGHSHVVIESLDALDQTTPTDPTKFVFFKGLNDAPQGGILTASVTTGLPAGAYRLCSINTAANHQPVLVPIAQHGALDDCVYFTASAGGASASGAVAATNSSPSTASSTAVPTTNADADRAASVASSTTGASADTGASTAISTTNAGSATATGRPSGRGGRGHRFRGGREGQR